MVEDYDIIVVGLGAHGSSAVYQCSKRGFRVLGIEAASRGEFTHGSSHGLSRVIRKAYFEHPSYVPLVSRSFELWKELEREECYEEGKLLQMTGALMIGSKTSEIISGTLNSCKEHNLEHTILRANHVSERYQEAFTLQEHEIAVHEDAAGVLFPEECILAYLKSAERSQNTTLKFNTKMTSFEEHEDGRISVHTTGDVSFTSRKLILCVGAWAGSVFGETLTKLVPLKVVRKVLYWFKPASQNSDATKSHSLADNTAVDWGNIPVYIWDCDYGAFYGFPCLDGLGCKVAIHHINRPEAECQPDSIDRSVGDAEVVEMRSLMTGRVPALSTGELLDSTTCMYTNTPNKHFLIDFYPKSKNVIICSACSGHGFKMAPVIGEILTDYATSGSTEYDVEMFTIAHAAQTIKETV